MSSPPPCGCKQSLPLERCREQGSMVPEVHDQYQYKQGCRRSEPQRTCQEEVIISSHHSCEARRAVRVQILVQLELLTIPDEDLRLGLVDNQMRIKRNPVRKGVQTLCKGALPAAATAKSTPKFGIKKGVRDESGDVFGNIWINSN